MIKVRFTFIVGVRSPEAIDSGGSAAAICTHCARLLAYELLYVFSAARMLDSFKRGVEAVASSGGARRTTRNLTEILGVIEAKD